MKRFVSLFAAVIMVVCTMLAGCSDVSGGDYTVTLEQAHGGVISGDKLSANKGEEVTLTAEPAYGYYLGTFLVNGEESGSTFTMPAQDVTVTARFEEDPAVTRYYVLTENSEECSVTVSGTRFVAGETVTVTAVPAFGYALVSILADGKEIEGNTFVMPESNVVVEARVAEDTTQYAVTAENDRYGRIVCGKTAAKAGTLIPVDYYPLDGYILSYFTLDGEPIELTDGCFVMPAKDCTVSGVFRKAIEQTDAVVAVACANSTSYAHWYFTYTESALRITVKVIDATPVMTGTEGIQDALECYLVTGTEGTLYQNRAVHVYAWRNGEYKVEVVNRQNAFEQTQTSAAFVSVTEKDYFAKEGYTGYEMTFELGYGLFNGTYAKLCGQLRVCLGMRNGETFAKTFYGSLGSYTNLTSYLLVNAYGEVIS